MFSSVLYYYYYIFFFIHLLFVYSPVELIFHCCRFYCVYTLKRYRSDIMFMKWKFNSSFLHGLSREWKTSFQRSIRCERNRRFSNFEIVTLMVEVEDDEFKCLYKQIYIEATLNTFSELCFHNFHFFYLLVALLLLCIIMFIISNIACEVKCEIEWNENLNNLIVKVNY